MPVLYTWLELGHHRTYYSDVIMGMMASRLSIVYSTIYSGADQRKHQSSTLLAFVKGIHLWPVNSPHKGPVTWKIFHLMTSSCWALNIQISQHLMIFTHQKVHCWLQNDDFKCSCPGAVLIVFKILQNPGTLSPNNHQQRTPNITCNIITIGCNHVISLTNLFV